MSPVLSIVTVTLDNLEGLQATLRSVARGLATRPDLAGALEVVVKDGGSRDGTADYLAALDLPGLRVTSGKDGGVYPAMNAALDLTTGDWVLFLNAGDTLARPEVLGVLLDRLRESQTANLVYSDSIAGGQLFQQTLSLGFLTRHMINHQTICYRRDLLAGGYDLRYRFCADYAHLLAIYPEIRAEKLPEPISHYDMTGMSSDPRNFHRTWQERLLAVWRSPLPILARLRLSSRGVLMWPLQRLRAVVA